MIKTSFIKKMPNGKYRVVSRKGRNLGEYTSREKAKERLRQIEFFKHKNASSDFFDLTEIDDLSLSAVMREINKKNKDKAIEFLQIFNKHFNKSIDNELQKPETIALGKALIEFGGLYNVKLDKDLIKSAAISELGSAEEVAKYLSSMIHFLMKRISNESRPKSMLSLKSKIYYMDEKELETKKMPASSAMGQSITLVKHILMNHDASYIRQVLNYLVRLL